MQHEENVIPRARPVVKRNCLSSSLQQNAATIAESCHRVLSIDMTGPLNYTHLPSITPRWVLMHGALYYFKLLLHHIATQ